MNKCEVVDCEKIAEMECLGCDSDLCEDCAEDGDCPICGADLEEKKKSK